MRKFSGFFKKNKVEASLIFFLVLFVYGTLPFLGYDNPLEEAVEWVIKAYTGVELELTPEILEDQTSIHEFDQDSL